MNGVVSASMREKGAKYKLNFGVSLLKIKEISENYPPDSDLAEALWQEDVRELKILAALVQPVEEFSPEQATRWASMIDQSEIAEFTSTILFQKLPYASELAAQWVLHPKELVRFQGFHLFARICLDKHILSKQETEILLREAKTAMDGEVFRMWQAAHLALKYFGRQSKAQANAVLTTFTDYLNSDFPRKQEFYKDLKFEFDYYQ